jgi:thioesterase domain-containing protein
MIGMKTPLDLQEFKARIYKEIPLSKAMQIEVLEASTDQVVVRAPLAPNINHKQTAFGGSVHSLGLLSCWALVTATSTLVEAEGMAADYIVVQDSKIDYQKPIAVDFSSRTRWPSEKEREKFLMTLRKRGRARATLRSEIFTGDGVCAILEARFVAQVTKCSTENQR